MKTAGIVTRKPSKEKRKGDKVNKKKLAGIILGIAGLIFVFYFMMALRMLMTDVIVLTGGKTTFLSEYWDAIVYSDSLMFLTASLIFGILALAFQSQKKSPYFMGISTILTSIAFLLSLVSMQDLP